MPAEGLPMSEATERLWRAAKRNPLPCPNPSCGHADGLHGGMGDACQFPDCFCLGCSWPPPSPDNRLPIPDELFDSEVPSES